MSKPVIQIAKRVILLLLLLCSAFSVRAAQPITPATLLKQESDISALADLHTWSSSLQSSYDRTGGNDDKGKFLSGDSKDGVMADMDGPGAVVRIWSANPNGEIKIFIDSSPIPVIDTAFQHLFDGSLAPFTAPLSGLSSGGSYSYLPLTYAHHCRIELLHSQDVYYQVNYLTFAPHTPTTAFSLPLSASDQAALAAANAIWANLAQIKQTTLPSQADSQTVPASQTLPLCRYQGPGVLRRIALALPNASDADLRRLVLRGYFDGHKTPDIEAPIADFFGNAYGRKPFRTLVLNQAADGSFEANFPMPFAHSARFTLENGTSRAQPIQWSADLVKSPYDAAKTGYFHAAFFQEMTTPKQAHLWARITRQRGRLVGIVQTMASTGGVGYLEGDDQFRADAQAWKHLEDSSTVIGPWNGTGTEDCFNCGWYFSGGPNSLPANAVLVKEEARGRIDCLRWFLNDAPTFQNSLDAQIEHGSDNGDAVNLYYSSVSYWYATGQTQPWSVMPAASALAPPAPPASLFNVPHGMEGEYLNAATAGGAGPQEMTRFGKLWSGNSQLFWNGAKLGSTLTLTLPPQSAGTYELVGYFTKANDYGQVSFTLNGTLLKTAFDGYHDGVIPSGPIDLGRVTLPNGPSTLVVTITGKNVKSTDTLFGLDALACNSPGSAPAPLPSE